MPGRSNSLAAYRYGMNGQEKENEVIGGDGVFSAEFWMYDSRSGRRWENDPITSTWESPYAAFSNNPIVLNDPNGLGDDTKDKKKEAKVKGPGFFKKLFSRKLRGRYTGKKTKEPTSDVETYPKDDKNRDTGTNGEEDSKNKTPNEDINDNKKDKRISFDIGASPFPANYMFGDKPNNGFKVTWFAANHNTLFKGLNFFEWSFHLGANYKIPDSRMYVGLSISKEKPHEFASGTYLEALSSENFYVGYILINKQNLKLSAQFGGGTRTAGVINGNSQGNAVYTANGTNWMGWNKQAGAQYDVGWGLTTLVKVDYKITNWLSLWYYFQFNSLIGKNIQTTNGTEKYDMIYNDMKLGISVKFKKN